MNFVSCESNLLFLILLKLFLYYLNNGVFFLRFLVILVRVFLYFLLIFCFCVVFFLILIRVFVVWVINFFVFFNLFWNLLICDWYWIRLVFDNLLFMVLIFDCKFWMEDEFLFKRFIVKFWNLGGSLFFRIFNVFFVYVVIRILLLFVSKW